MNKVVLATVALVSFLIFFWYAKNNSIHVSEYVDESIITPESKNRDKNIIKIVEKINQKNQNIKTLAVDSMPMRVSTGGATYKLNGNLLYEKEKNFRLKVHHRLTGLEMDIGSNNSEFWFWSKRMQPPALYFSPHDKLGTTNLKTPLNPAWMIESLNIGLVDTKNIAQTSQKGNLCFTYEPRTSALGDPVTMIAVYDLKNLCVVGRNLIDEDGNKIITTSYEGDTMNTLWHNEGIIMEWNMATKQVNPDVDRKIFVLPDYKKKIDLSK